MTGFSKRKQARQTAVRNKAIEREREEKNEARRAVSCSAGFDARPRGMIRPGSFGGVKGV